MRTEPPFPADAMLAALYQHSADAVVIADANRRIVGCNAAFTALFGYGVDEIKGRSTQTLYANPDDFDAQGARYFNTGRPRRNGAKFIEYRRKDGSAFGSETLATQVRDASGAIIGFIAAIRDMSDMFEYIVQLKEDNRALLAALDAHERRESERRRAS